MYCCSPKETKTILERMGGNWTPRTQNGAVTVKMEDERLQSNRESMEAAHFIYRCSWSFDKRSGSLRMTGKPNRMALPEKHRVCGIRVVLLH